MSRERKSKKAGGDGAGFLLDMIVLGLLLATAGCRPFPHAGSSLTEFKATILSDAVSVRSRLGNHFYGYRASYESDFRKSYVFLAFEITKYEAGEKLDVRGYFRPDSIRMPEGEAVGEMLPVFFVWGAAPPAGKRSIPVLPPVLGAKPGAR